MREGAGGGDTTGSLCASQTLDFSIWFVNLYVSDRWRQKKKKQDGSATCRERAPTPRQNDGANAQKRAAYVCFQISEELNKRPQTVRGCRTLNHTVQTQWKFLQSAMTACCQRLRR